MTFEPLILASASPRRAEILQNVGWAFEKLPVDLDESLLEKETPQRYVERLALEKARTASLRLNSGLVLGADTTVVIDGKVLGKPKDESDAKEMLGLLSECWHEVLTGVALIRVNGESESSIETTRVKFAKMSSEEIEYYISTKEPMGKAGAYAIQGFASLFIEKIEGDYWNVVGLPIRLVYEISKRI